MTKALKRVQIDHGRAILEPQYLEDRCQAALAHYRRRHGHMVETVIHAENGSCCAIEPWKVTALRFRSRIAQIVKEEKGIPDGELTTAHPAPVRPGPPFAAANRN